MASTNLTAARLREVIDYNPDTGVFKWRSTGKGRREAPGSFVGTTGYLQIRIDRKTYKGHRLAWFYMTGEWPAADIDHMNGVRTDNRFANLRAVTRGENLQNQRIPKSHNRTGFLGVIIDRRLKKSTRKYIALIVVDGKQRRVGSFHTAEEAHAAYVDAKRRQHPMCTI